MHFGQSGLRCSLWFLFLGTDGSLEFFFMGNLRLCYMFGKLKRVLEFGLDLWFLILDLLLLLKMLLFDDLLESLLLCVDLYWRGLPYFLLLVDDIFIIIQTTWYLFLTKLTDILLLFELLITTQFSFNHYIRLVTFNIFHSR